MRDDGAVETEVVEAEVETKVSVVDGDVAAVEALLRLAFEADLRIEGVSRDSRALGSSRVVYLPMDGLCITYRNSIHVRQADLKGILDRLPDAGQSSFRFRQ